MHFRAKQMLPLYYFATFLILLTAYILLPISYQQTNLERSKTAMLLISNIKLSCIENNLSIMVRALYWMCLYHDTKQSIKIRGNHLFPGVRRTFLFCVFYLSNIARLYSSCVYCYRIPGISSKNSLFMCYLILLHFKKSSITTMGEHLKVNDLSNLANWRHLSIQP